MGRFADQPGQAKELFGALVDTLKAQVKEGQWDGRDRELVQVMETVCGEYVLDMNEAPPAIQLERLANILLRDELTAMKKPKRDYPVLSDRQQELRDSRQTKFVERQ